MFDERSFSQASFDARSWLFAQLAQSYRRVRQFFVRSAQLAASVFVVPEKEQWIKKSK